MKTEGREKIGPQVADISTNPLSAMDPVLAMVVDPSGKSNNPARIKPGKPNGRK